MDGSFKKYYKLFVRGDRFAVDEKEGIFVINGKGKGNIRFVNMKNGKLISYGNLPEFGNEFADKLFLWETIPIVTDKYYIFTRVFYPEVIVLNKNFKMVKNIFILPEERESKIEKFNDRLSNMQNDGLECFTFSSLLVGNYLIILNSGYVTKIYLKDLSKQFFLTYQEPNRKQKEKGIKVVNLNFRFFYFENNELYLNNPNNDNWFIYDIFSKR